jgi:hypothetical protein
MRREGSPWQGLGVVTLKELSDHLASARMRVLEWLVVLTALAAVYGAIQQIRINNSGREGPYRNHRRQKVEPEQPRAELAPLYPPIRRRR